MITSNDDEIFSIFGLNDFSNLKRDQSALVKISVNQQCL